jgi:hypothetical protein
VVIVIPFMPTAKTQWVVTDPKFGSRNSQFSKTDYTDFDHNQRLTTLKKSKVYNQGKEYYDKLKAVNNLVKMLEVQQTVLLVGDVSEMYVNNFGKMLNDPISMSRN